MKIAAIADLHGFLPEVPECDLLLIAGDICPDYYNGKRHNQAAWLEDKFKPWLELQKVPIVATWGNHDFVGQRVPHLVPDMPWHLLVDQEVEINGLRIYGTPWTPLFGYWAFMRPDDELPFEKIPEGLDVLIVHGPPHGFGDEVYDGEHVGSRKLFQEILRAKPKVCVFGHIHEGRGEWGFHGMRLANVTHVDMYYEPVYPVWTIEI